MSQDQYIDMCEQMGWEIDESQMPVEPSTLAYEVQQALLVLNVLPDKWVIVAAGNRPAEADVAEFDFALAPPMIESESIFFEKENNVKLLM